MTVHVFVGPTLAAHEVVRLAEGAVTHPPVRHGDLLRLPLEHGDVAVIIDGFYHQSASVRHKEILHVLANGVTVVGCSSMGALRAAELHPYGMIGSGRVFAMYRDGVIDGDDEVAVAHDEAPSFRTFSIPLVNLRHAIAQAETAGALSPRQAGEIVAVAREVPYSSRSWQAVKAEGVDELRAFLTRHPEHGDLKAADARATLSRLGAFRPPDPDAHDWIRTNGWRSAHLHEWLATFRGTSVEGIHVGDAAAIRYRQIYEQDFPRRWRDHVLTRIAGGQTQALAAAAEAGVRLTAAHRRAWLTADEAERLSDAEALLLVLIRSYRRTGDVHALVAAEGVNTMDEHRTAVAGSQAINAEVAGWEPGRSIELLKNETLSTHLAQTWKAHSGEHLKAAARDRGFASVRHAVRAARPFYLRHHFLAVSS